MLSRFGLSSQCCLAARSTAIRTSSLSRGASSSLVHSCTLKMLMVYGGNLQLALRHSTTFASTPGGTNNGQRPMSSAALPSQPSSSSSSSSQQPSTSTYTPEVLLSEVHTLLVSPLPMGYLFRALTSDGKRWLTSQNVSIEQFLLRHPKHFAVFQEPGERTIMASRSSHMPPHALRGSEATGDELFSGGKAKTVETKHILNILKYVPNDWSAFVDLGIPESLRVNVMSRKAKAYFERYPEYFEVKAQGLNQHTFFVRRSLALQKQTEQVASSSTNSTTNS